jgi:predicted phosphodiesterase
MKILLISDMHGKSPRDLVENLEFDEAVFLGDYDTPQVLKDLLTLDLRKKFLVGNHELHYVWNLGITTSNGIPWQKYAELWKQNTEEFEFIENAAEGKIPNAGFILEDNLNGRRVCYCHASIVDSGSPDSDAPGYIWQEMNSNKSSEMNFNRMRKIGYNLMFRGHAHQEFVKRAGNNGIETLFEKKLELPKNNLHIVSVGAFVNGNYALFDSTTGIVEFKGI